MKPVARARDLASLEERLRERPERRDVVLVRIIARARRECVLGDELVERVVPQVALHIDVFGARLVRDDFLRVALDDDVQRQRRAVIALLQREHVDDVVRQHRDLVARHVDGRQPRARDRVDRVAAHDAERGRRDVHADPHAPVGQVLDGERVVDFGRRDVVDRERVDVRARQILGQLADRDGRKARAVREVFGEKARLVQRARRRNAAAVEHQARRRHAARERRRIERLVFDRVLVRLRQQAERLARERVGQPARLQLLLVAGLHERLLALALEPGQRHFQLLLGRALILAAPLAAEVDGRAVQAQHERRALDGAVARAEIFVGERGIREFLGGRALPQEIQIDLLGGFVRLLHQLARRGLLEFDQHVLRAHLRAPAAGNST